MPDKTARAAVEAVRQRTQYTCMSTSLMMCLKACGVDTDEGEVNKVMGAKPMRGAAWEDALAAAQHYGMRATLTCPATVRQLKAWTDAGVPVMIAWNPEGRDWSHASVVYHVAEGPLETVSSDQVVDGDGPGLYVWVADPNIPNPEKTTRIVHEDQFYKRWFEKWPDYLVRRPACAIEPEITLEGRQVVASKTTTDGGAMKPSVHRVAARYLSAEAADCWSDYNAGGLSWDELQDCLERFEEDEDDDDYYYRRPSPRPKEPDNLQLKFRSYSPEFNAWRIRLDRAYMAGMAAGDSRAPAITQPVWSFVGMGVKPEDVERFKAFEKKHQRLISKMPAKPGLHNVGKFPIMIRIDALTPREREDLDKYFRVEPAPHAREWLDLYPKR